MPSKKARRPAAPAIPARYFRTCQTGESDLAEWPVWDAEQKELLAWDDCADAWTPSSDDELAGRIDALPLLPHVTGELHVVHSDDSLVREVLAFALADDVLLVTRDERRGDRSVRVDAASPEAAVKSALWAAFEGDAADFEVVLGGESMAMHEAYPDLVDEPVDEDEDARDGDDEDDSMNEDAE